VRLALLLSILLAFRAHAFPVIRTLGVTLD